ncbi:MAG: amidohydrolase family protein [Candidatus Nanopelagicales bacterium]
MTCPAGPIVVDGSGRPTGLLQEQAQNLLAPLRRPVPVDEVARAIARASDVYVRQGITSVVEAGVGGGWIGRTPVEVLAYQRARDAGQLDVRVELMVASDVLHALRGTEPTTSAAGSTWACAPDSATTACAWGR